MEFPIGQDASLPPESDFFLTTRTSAKCWRLLRTHFLCQLLQKSRSGKTLVQITSSNSIGSSQMKMHFKLLTTHRKILWQSHSIHSFSLTLKDQIDKRQCITMTLAFLWVSTPSNLKYLHIHLRKFTLLHKGLSWFDLKAQADLVNQ